ncbi:hypothetical protein RND81_07G147700 [Saponaria officinalis]|uniref:Protein yippee-like n=1 Tax=Saponaria officinalis TaxID=3572 RepID=A0AAW1JQS9_SAPOF
MGRVFKVELDGKIYRCKSCDNPLAFVDDVLSRSFSCSQGRAYLFENVVNVSVGKEENRLMLSGTHTVADVSCCGCGQLLGWKYMIASDKNQKYKEGKLVLERWRITEDLSDEYNVNALSSDLVYP